MWVRIPPGVPKGFGRRASQMIDSFKGEHEFLSNFHLFEGYYLNNNVYLSAEHAYQAQKAVRWEDRKAIEEARTPALAKKIGRQIEIRPDWEYVKLYMMLKIVRRKFDHQPLAVKLLQTGDETLVEGNSWGDEFWGVC